MAAPNYILAKGSAKPTEKPYYIGHVQHESVMTAKVTFADGTLLTLSATIADA